MYKLGHERERERERERAREREREKKKREGDGRPPQVMVEEQVKSEIISQLGNRSFHRERPKHISSANKFSRT